MEINNQHYRSVNRLSFSDLLELFINVGTNYSIYDHQHSCVVYDELDIKDPAKELDFMRTQVSTGDNRV